MSGEFFAYSARAMLDGKEFTRLRARGWEDRSPRDASVAAARMR